MSDTVLGIDVRGDDCLVARVSQASGRLSIDRVERHPGCDLAEVLQNGAAAGISLAADQTMVKRVKLAGEDHLPIEDRLLFEIEQSLLEPLDLFRVDLLPINDGPTHLALISRRQDLSERAAHLNLAEQYRESRIQFRVAPLALGRGYLNFCRTVEGDLVSLVEINGCQVSICLIYRRHVVDIAQLRLPHEPLESPEQLSRLAIELKTVINFRLAALMNDSISQPLSALLIAGDLAVETVRGPLSRFFSLAIEPLEIHSGFLSQTEPIESGILRQSLVALGLSVH